ncbi:ORF6C domain-containing protein [Mammaliicoccus sciuri]|uniref:BRO family protein n=1 Tax=Mammaliicoccus sciuri TaxID=1296 RepID=UPI002DB6BD05|nr:BRO family protein [Mammaliicoccus sciuri]MEB5649851.1 ORF6C domain-containing protein [Mammaliicoccus sciuri]
MTNDLQIFNFEQLPVRTVVVNDEPYFVGKDVANILGYKNGSRDVNAHVDEEDKLKYQISTSGQKRNQTLINESGLYSLIFSSKLDSSKRFKRWVTSEVLPTLRKTGSYQVKPLTTSEQIQLIAQGNTELDERVTAIEESYPIMHGQAKHIQQLVARKVAEIVRNKFNGYYKETSKKLFAEIYRSIKKIFQVPTYNCIPRGRYEEAVKFIEQWQPSYETVYQLELNLKEA